MIAAVTAAPMPTRAQDGVGRLRKNPKRPKTPARRPISTATTKNGAAKSEWKGAGRT